MGTRENPTRIETVSKATGTIELQEEIEKELMEEDPPKSQAIAALGLEEDEDTPEDDSR
jgi:hypothetical protein